MSPCDLAARREQISRSRASNGLFRLARRPSRTSSSVRLQRKATQRSATLDSLLGGAQAAGRLAGWPRSARPNGPGRRLSSERKQYFAASSGSACLFAFLRGSPPPPFRRPNQLAGLISVGVFAAAVGRPLVRSASRPAGPIRRASSFETKCKLAGPLDTWRRAQQRALAAAAHSCGFSAGGGGGRGNGGIARQSGRMEAAKVH